MASDDERRGGGAGRTVGDALLVEQERRGAGAGLLQDAQERGVDTAEGVEQEDQDEGRRVDAPLPRERSAAADDVEQEHGVGVDGPVQQEDRRADGDYWFLLDDDHVHQAVLICGAVLFLYVSGKLLLRASAFFLAASAAAPPPPTSRADPEKNVCGALGGNYGDLPASSCHVEGKRGAVASPIIQTLLMIVAVVAFLQGFL